VGWSQKIRYMYIKINVIFHPFAEKLPVKGFAICIQIGTAVRLADVINCDIFLQSFEGLGFCKGASSLFRKFPLT